MVDTLNKPCEVIFNGITYKLLSQGRYYLSQSNTNAGRRNAKSLHVAIWEFYNNRKVPKGYCIHHKDENVFNNDISNLECKRKKEHLSEHGKKNWENKEYRERGIQQLNKIRGKASDWHKSSEGLIWHQLNKKNYSKPVYMCDLENNILKRYESMTDAANDTKICFTSIAKRARGKQKNCRRIYLETCGGIILCYQKIF